MSHNNLHAADVHLEVEIANGTKPGTRGDNPNSPTLMVDPGDRFGLLAEYINPEATRANICICYTNLQGEPEDSYVIIPDLELNSIVEGKWFQGTALRTMQPRNPECFALHYVLHLRYESVSARIIVGGSMTPQWVIGDLSMGIEAERWR